MEDRKAYVIRVGDHGYHIVGPFDSDDAACHWAEYRNDVQGINPNNTMDDPRWQLVHMTYQNAQHPSVVHPNSPGVANRLAELQGYGTPRVVEANNGHQ